MNKHALIETLHAWINQRPGLEPANYMRGWDDTAGRSAYRSDARSITKDLHDARYLLDYIAIRDSISAERILNAAKHNFSGRLSITPVRRHSCNCGHKWDAPVQLSKETPNLSGEKTQWCEKCGSRPNESSPVSYRIDYCIGQYWSMEYRKATAAVLRGAIWDWLSEERTDAEAVRKAARREFPASIARRWFQ